MSYYIKESIETLLKEDYKEKVLLEKYKDEIDRLEERKIKIEEARKNLQNRIEMVYENRASKL